MYQILWIQHIDVNGTPPICLRMGFILCRWAVLLLFYFSYSSSLVPFALRLSHLF